MGVRTKHGQARAEGPERLSGKFPLCSGIAYSNPWISVEVPVPDSQDNPAPQGSPSGTLWKLCHTGKGLGDLKGDDHLSAMSTA